jgi:hypothetical protein
MGESDRFDRPGSVSSVIALGRGEK